MSPDDQRRVARTLHRLTLHHQAEQMGLVFALLAYDFAAWQRRK